ncbi:MAG TPA: hypothetical protein PKM25_00605, partial [Candidatus Ozemobacteraceae bacterium]|nr:hypothetical protein [Candidatus Ozemobacteraceae bacterium]
SSAGSVVYSDGPAPTSGTVSPGSPLTFIWHFIPTADTGLVGSFSMTSSAQGYDANTNEATDTLTVLSNSITITRRSLALASEPIDFGTMSCNEFKTVGNTNVNNLGNVGLTNLRWQSIHLYRNGTSYINRSSIGFSPSNGFAVAPTGSVPASLTLMIPYNQASGTYSNTLNLWDDYAPANAARDVNEPFDEFTVTVVVGETELIVLNNALLDMGNTPQGSQVATQTFSAFNGGNLPLEKLKFKASPATLTATISITPAAPGNLATDGVLIASISALIDPAAVSGIYLATYTLFEDNDSDDIIDPGEPQDSIQFKFSVGDQSFVLTPPSFGNGTPTYTISNIPFTIQNTGSLALTALKLFPIDLTMGGSGTIPGENFIPELPAFVAPGATVNATMSLYVAAGSPAGLYTGTLRLFEDLDGDGTYVGDPSEATADVSIQVTINPFQALDVVNATISLGGRIPGETAQVGFLCRNIGSVDLTSLTWTKTNLDSGADTISSSAYTFSPGSYFSAAPGETFIATVSITIPDPKTDGEYYGLYGWMFDDPPVDGKDVSDPQDKFVLYCKIGAKSVNIVEALSQITGAEPHTTSAAISYTVNNNGILVLARPVATLTLNLSDGLGNSIPTSSVTLTPTIFPYINSGQSKTGTWKVQIPANAPSGTYSGQLKVWNDENANNAIETFEATDTCQLQVQVVNAPKIAVMQNPLDLFFIAAGQSGTGSFEIRNVGNVDLSGIPLRAIPGPINPIAPGPSPIAAPVFTLTTPATFKEDGSGSCMATLSVSVPLGQTSMPYEGTQVLYADTDGDNVCDAGEAVTSFSVKLTIGEKKISADTPIQFGARVPGSPFTLPFKVYNLTSIGISKGRWSLKPMQTTAGDIFPPSAISIVPNPFTIGPNSNKACTLTLTIPATQAPGDYVATHTAYEDENNNGALDGFEASATFQVTLSVATYPRLMIVPSLVNAGTVTAGGTSAQAEISVYNAGNTTFSSFGWTTSALSNAPQSIAAGLLTFGPILPATLSSGQYGTATVVIGPIPASQVAGTYTGSQLLSESSYYPAYPGASDSVLLSLTVTAPTTGPDVGSGSAYQEIATSTFAAASPGNRFILSAWICPGTGTAAIGFFRADDAGVKTGYDGIMIGHDSNLSQFGTLVESGILDARVVRNRNFPTDTFTWYRVYATFDYTFDTSSASTTWLLLQNQSPTNASYSVWFDGVQLEQPVVEGQTRPTVFTTNKKIVDPSKEKSFSGDQYYYEW